MQPPLPLFQILSCLDNRIGDLSSQYVSVRRQLVADFATYGKNSVYECRRSELIKLDCRISECFTIKSFLTSEPLDYVKHMVSLLSLKPVDQPTLSPEAQQELNFNMDSNLIPLGYGT